MSVEQIATWIGGTLFVYLGLGLLFAIPFGLRGVDRVDPAAPGSSMGFRLILLPGAAALWHLLLARWLSAKGPPTERNDHRRAAGIRR